MKTTKSFKTLALITALSLVFGALVSFGSFATEEAALGVRVDQTNLAYNEMMHLAINLEVTETLDEGDTLGIIVWDDTVTDALTAENATYKTFEEKEDEYGTKYFTSHPIPAPKIGDDLRIAGCIKDADGNLKYGEVLTYSIVDYLNDRIADPKSTPLQIDLYEKTLAYAKAAGAVFAD